MNTMDLVERGRVPDAAVRFGIRRLLRQRIRECVPRSCEARAQGKARFIEQMNDSAVAVHTTDANAQHYEVPSEFFQQVMGEHLKYSCCLYQAGTSGLSAAESAMLEQTCQRAGLADGQDILELGCGWGSLSLWMASRFPHARVTAVSNSSTQKRFIDECSASRGLDNLSVVTADMNKFETDDRYDRVVSVEMFEHMRNWRELLSRVALWLKPNGRFFMHVFCHRDMPYLFTDSGSDDDWMARHFFTGGMMPSADLPLHFQEHLRFERYDAVSGTHYARTCNDWLATIDKNASTVLEILAGSDNPDPAPIQMQRWRMFFMACAELFAFDAGNEWHVGHYRFVRP